MNDMMWRKNTFEGKSIFIFKRIIYKKYKCMFMVAFLNLLNLSFTVI